MTGEVIYSRSIAPVSVTVRPPITIHIAMATDGDGTEKKRKGCFMTIPTILFFITLFVAACIAVALIMWFAIPRKKCMESLPKRISAQSCGKYMQQVGKEKFCTKSPDEVRKEKEEKRRKDEAERKRQEEEKKKRQEEEKVAAEKAAEAAALRTGLRLNKTLIPHHYDLSLWPRFYEGDDFSFTGNVTIHFTCKMETNVIVLHANMLTVHKEKIILKDSAGAEQRIGSTEQDVPRHFYKIYPQYRLMTNRNYTLQLSFNGTLIHYDSLGFYRSSYIENNKTHWTVITQFQRVGARRCFPLFDEPSFKATFSVTMVRKANYTALSNMERAFVTDRGGGWYADTFDKSLVMTPYLLAFSISKYTFLEKYAKDGTRVRIYTQPALISDAEYAINISTTMYDAFEEWIGIPDPIPKLDQFVIRDWRFSAMENWGLVNYRDRESLYNPDYSTTDQKQFLAFIIGHELSHSWFGNLVNLYWWDDTFLNEAFTTYLGYFIAVKAAEPSWNVEEYLIRIKQNIMEEDGSHTVQPVRLPNLEHHDDLIKAFSNIVYYKGGAILMMVRDFLGPQTFLEGTKRYLKDHAYKSAVDEDFYQALQTQAEEDGSVTWDTQKTNISRILKTWHDQQNFPLLHVTDLVNGSLKVTQSRFVYDQSQNVSFPTPLGSEFLWEIPIFYTDTTQETKFAWMYREKQILLHGVQRHGWKYLNPKLYGYYRVRYGDETWNAILYQLMQNHTVFPVENRAGFIDDAFEIAKAGQMEEVNALRSTEYLNYEREYLPWYPGLNGRTNFYLDMFFGKPAYEQLELYLLSLLIPMYNMTGWVVSEDPGVLLDKLTRSLIIEKACEMNYKPCVDQAKELYQQFMKDPNNNPIHPDLRSAVYCTGVATGRMSEWDFLMGRYQHNYGDVFIALENSTIANALACAKRTNVIRKYLDYALAYNSTVMFTMIAKKREARETVWNYIVERWDDFMDGNVTRISKSEILTAVTSTWNTNADIKKLKDFMMTHDEADLSSTYESIMKTIEKNINWLDNNMAPIENWLKAVNSGQSYERIE